MASITFVSAHDPPWEVATYSYLAVSPDPAGANQDIFLVFWVHPNPPTAVGIGGDRWKDITILVTKPDGTTHTLGPFVTDPTGSGYSLYTPTQIGEYTFLMNYPGQVLGLYHPETGEPPEAAPPYAHFEYLNDTFLPSTATQSIIVQEEPVEKIADIPLPTGYWTRPIEGQNSAWASVASNWLSGAHLGVFRLWQEDGVGPSSAHIMWTKPIEFGGIVGTSTQIPGVGFYSGGSYEGRFNYAIIMNGQLSFQMPLGHSASGGGYVSLDLRTGEEVWYRDDIGNVGPSKGQLYNYESINQHGVVGGQLWQTAGPTWIGYDGFSGINTYNLTNVPNGVEAYTENGEIVRYILDYENRRLLLWNNTQEQIGLHGATGTGSSAFQWRPNGKEVDMSNAYSWNVSIPDLPGSDAAYIVNVIPDDLILGSSTFPRGFSNFGTEDPFTLWAISLKPANRGQLLWLKNYPAPGDSLTRGFGPHSEIAQLFGLDLPLQSVDPINRVFLLSDEETFQYSGYSLDTGQLLWGPVGENLPALQYYGSGLGGGQIHFLAYGNLYVQGFGGEIQCYSTKDGTLLWEFTDTNSGLETVWGKYPIFIGAIADGKVYAFSNEHSPNYPLYKGERVRCINATTGEEIWNLLGWAGQSGGPGTSTMLEADGYLVYYNYYDNQIYCVGKGPSATTVAAPDVAVTLGDSLMIKGTVTDQSSGAKDTPAISDDDMGPWMEYLYMQKPIPADATGVEVILDVIDSNGNYRNIGTATTDISGAFGLMWQPDIPGQYTVVATFAGSESYGGSYAQTYLGVVDAPVATPPPEQTPASPTETYIAGSTIAILAAIAVVAFLLLRKK